MELSARNGRLDAPNFTVLAVAAELITVQCAALLRAGDAGCRYRFSTSGRFFFRAKRAMLAQSS
jgi:hypothetical protein